MSAAKVTLTLSADQFDTLRSALREAHKSALDIVAAPTGADPSVRSAARQRAVELNDLLTALR